MRRFSQRRGGDPFKFQIPEPKSPTVRNGDPARASRSAAFPRHCGRPRLGVNRFVPCASMWKPFRRPGEVMQNKREYLTRLSGWLGILSLLERLAAARPGLFVFTYHRIAEPGADPFYDPVISATPESFRGQADGLARRMRVLTLAEAMEQIASGPPWRESAALITFDDGYRDNFEVAAPILRDCGLPATFFLPTEFLE